MFNQRLLIVLFLVCFPLLSFAAKGGNGKNDDRDEVIDESRIANLEQQIYEFETLLAGMSRATDPNTGEVTMTFSGMNLQIVNGLGSTSATDGTGNLIIGYNELREESDNLRGGSHMLVIGTFNNYTESAYGGMTVGAQNESSAPFASLGGGTYNLANGWASSISGGSNNIADGEVSTINGGSDNIANGYSASVSGGRTNTAGWNYASVSGGISNSAIGWGASVSGGRMNTADWYYASVSGGNQNTASGYVASVSGGDAKHAISAYCWEADDQNDC